MQKDWFPFFSMLFWCVTKISGLTLGIMGMWGLASLARGFEFLWLLFAVLVPLGLAFVLLMTEIVFDLATAEMRGRQAVAK